MCIYWRIMIIVLLLGVIENPCVWAKESIHVQQSESGQNTYSMTVSKAPLSDVVEPSVVVIKWIYLVLTH